MQLTSFLHAVGEIKVLKKCLNEKEKLRLLNTIGVSCKVSDTTVKDAEKFVQTVFCKTMVELSAMRMKKLM